MQQPSIPSAAEALKEEGNKLQAQQRYDLALEKYRAALQIAPNFVAANFNSGLMLKRLGRIQEALHAFQDTVKHDPKHEKALNQIRELINPNAVYYQQQTDKAALIQGRFEYCNNLVKKLHQTFPCSLSSMLEFVEQNQTLILQHKAEYDMLSSTLKNQIMWLVEKSTLLVSPEAVVGIYSPSQAGLTRNTLSLFNNLGKVTQIIIFSALYLPIFGIGRHEQEMGYLLLYYILTDRNLFPLEVYECQEPGKVDKIYKIAAYRNLAVPFEQDNTAILLDSIGVNDFSHEERVNMKRLCRLEDASLAEEFSNIIQEKFTNFSISVTSNRNYSLIKKLNEDNEKFKICFQEQLWYFSQHLKILNKFRTTFLGPQAANLDVKKIDYVVENSSFWQAFFVIQVTTRYAAQAIQKVLTFAERPTSIENLYVKIPLTSPFRTACSVVGAMETFLTQIILQMTYHRSTDYRNLCIAKLKTQARDLADVSMLSKNPADPRLIKREFKNNIPNGENLPLCYITFELAPKYWDILSENINTVFDNLDNKIIKNPQTGHILLIGFQPANDTVFSNLKNKIQELVKNNPLQQYVLEMANASENIQRILSKRAKRQNELQERRAILRPADAIVPERRIIWKWINSRNEPQSCSYSTQVNMDTDEIENLSQAIYPLYRENGKLYTVGECKKFNYSSLTINDFRNAGATEELFLKMHRILEEGRFIPAEGKSGLKSLNPPMDKYTIEVKFKSNASTGLGDARVYGFSVSGLDNNGIHCVLYVFDKLIMNSH